MTSCWTRSRRCSSARARGQVPPLAVYVPRAPERFDAVAGLIAARGLRLRRRSEVLDAGYRGLSTPDAGLDTADILLGDSMGEMHFYLALTDRCVVGGGFARGAHNMIEPLSLCKPVLVGQNIGTIEHPTLAAIEAGVLRLCDDASALAQALEPDGFSPSDAQIDAFFAAHRGGVRRTMAAIPELLAHAAAQAPRFTRR